jgi:UMF1 family MFS transporter
MNKLEKSWILYDVGNSAFTMMVTTIIPIYFKNLASASGVSSALSTAYWGYAASISTVIIAILGPVLGSVGDLRGYKKPLFLAFMAIGVAGCLGLALPVGWLAFLVIFIIGKSGYSGSLIFYDAMLPDVADAERADRLSSYGFAWGYIGSCVPFVACLGLILTAGKTGLGTLAATKLAFLITAVWWVLFTVPLMRRYRQRYFIESGGRPVKESLSRLGNTIVHFKQNKSIFSFLLAFFLYIDGVYTIIEMAVTYGKDVGITDNNLLLALLLTQIVAFPCALLFGHIVKKIAAVQLISVSILGYLGITLFALGLDKTWEFWFLAVCVAVFQGGIQALSRSYFSRIIPKENANEFFGIYDIFGKGAAFTGTLLMGALTQITGHSRFGVAGIALILALGYFALRRHVAISKRPQAQ